MGKRRFLVLGAAAVATVAVVGISTAATTSVRGDSVRPAKNVRGSAVKNARMSAVTNGGVVSSSTNTGAGVSEFWTPQRIKSAQPREKTVSGGAPSPSSSPSTVVATPAQPQGTSARKSVHKKPAAKNAGLHSGTTSSPTSGDDPAGYWTQDRMDTAQPRDTNVSGDGGQGSPGTSDSGVVVTTAP